MVPRAQLVLTATGPAYAIDLHAEYAIGFLAQVFPIVIVGLTVQLIGDEVQVAVVGCHQRIRPQRARVVYQGLLQAVRLAPDNRVVFICRGIDAPLRI
jgi:hypothetical protein